MPAGEAQTEIAGAVRTADTHFSPLDPDLFVDFWPQIADIREQHPVGWSDRHWSAEGTGFWLLNEYHDVMHAAADWQTFSSKDGACPVQFDLDVLRMIPLETDPPVHRGIRRLLNPFFTPAALAANESTIRQTVEDLITECAKQSPVDFVEAFAGPLPSKIFMEGFLDQKGAELRWILDLLSTLFAEPERAMELSPKLMGWCAELLEGRRAEGRRDDLVGVVAHMGFGDDGMEMSERERVETLNLLVQAGMETTAGGLSNVALALASDQALREQLRGADEETLDRAVEEFLRFSSPVPTAARTLGEDSVMGGCPMNRGERVLLNWAAANRDPEQFPDPDKLDISRPNTGTHVAFGAGVHRCLGNHLARREMKATVIAICGLSRFELEPGFEVKFRPSFVLGPMTLPVFLER